MKVAQLCPTLCDPMDCSLPGASVHGILQERILEWVAVPFSRGSSQPRDRTQVSELQADSLLPEPPGKPKNVGVGSLSLLEGILLTQELNWGLLHWRWILYQLSCQGSPHADNEGATLCSPGVGLIKYIHKEPSTFSRNVWHFFKPLHPMCLPFACSPVQANTLCSR